MAQNVTLYNLFGNDVTINQFSDVLQNDFWNLFSEDIKRQILICTPEKLSYVLHHDPFFLSAIDLFVFDEGHMFDDGGRGSVYIDACTGGEYPDKIFIGHQHSKRIEISKSSRFSKLDG